MVDLIKEYRAFVRNSSRRKPDKDPTLPEFLEFLAQENRLNVSEGEWYAFGKSKGLSDGEIADLVESAAGWVSSSGDVLNEKAADWACEDPTSVEIDRPKSQPRKAGTANAPAHVKAYDTSRKKSRKARK